MFTAFAFSLILMQADFPICPAASFSGYPASVYHNDLFYVFWIDQRTLPNMSLYGARIMPDGTVLDPTGIQVYVDSVSYSCSAAFDGTNFLVLTRNHC